MTDFNSEASILKTCLDDLYRGDIDSFLFHLNYVATTPLPSAQDITDCLKRYLAGEPPELLSAFYPFSVDTIRDLVAHHLYVRKYPITEEDLIFKNFGI